MLGVGRGVLGWVLGWVLRWVDGWVVVYRYGGLSAWWFSFVYWVGSVRGVARNFFFHTSV